MQTIHNYLEAMKKRRDENGEGGFSLIELIIVVVILGILVAIAIPIFVNIQNQAQINANQAAASNGATAAAAAFANSATNNASATAAARSGGSGNIHTDFATVTGGANTGVSDVCVVAYTGTAAPATLPAKNSPTTTAAVAGPGCP